MGSVIEFKHEKCGFEFVFLEGAGFSLFRKQCEARRHMRDGDWGEHWKSLIERYPEGTALLNTALCYCEKCSKYWAEPCVQFCIPKDGYHYNSSDDNLDMVPERIIYEHYRLLETEQISCPDCENIAKLVEEPYEIYCPVCGEKICGLEVGN